MAGSETKSIARIARRTVLSNNALSVSGLKASADFLAARFDPRIVNAIR